MIGAIIGDIYGSPYEYQKYERKDFCLNAQNQQFTDDTVLTVAVADALLNNKDLTKTIVSYCRKYPDSRYGSKFKEWFNSTIQENGDSFGNGSAMRISSIPLLFKDIDTIYQKVEESVKMSHGHIEGIKGAKAIAKTIYLAKKENKEKIRELVEKEFNFNVSKTLEELHLNEEFSATCQKTVPEAINVFLESKNFEETIKNAILIKGDTDTIASMAGAIAEAYYGLDFIPKYMKNKMEELIPNDFKEIIKRIY